MKDLIIFSGSAHPRLAQNIAAALRRQLGGVLLKRFPGEETFVKYTETIRDLDVFIIQPISAPANETLMEMLIMIDAAKRASSARITAVIPYFGYARQDRKDQPRVPITAKLVANLLTVAGADRILTMDLHALQIQGFFDIPVDHLSASTVFAAHLKQRLGEKAIVVAPDIGSSKMAYSYVDVFKCGFALVAKRRLNAYEVEAPFVVGDVAGHDCLLVDDLTSTAGTLIEAATRLRLAQASTVCAAVTHCCLTENALCRVNDSDLKCLFTTDTVPLDVSQCTKIEVVSVAPLFAEAISRIHRGVSVSSLCSLESGR